MEPKNWTLHGPEQVIQFGSNVVPALSMKLSSPTIGVWCNTPLKGTRTHLYDTYDTRKPDLFGCRFDRILRGKHLFQMSQPQWLSDRISTCCISLIQFVLYYLILSYINKQQSHTAVLRYKCSEIDKPNPVTSVAAWTSSVTRGLGVGHDRMMQWCISTQLLQPM